MATGAPVQQTVTFRASTVVPPTGTPAAAGASTTVAGTAPGQQVSYQERSQHYADPAAPHIVKPTAADYVPMAATRHRAGPPPTEDGYAHLQPPPAAPHGGMMYRPGTVMPGGMPAGYGMPMGNMGMPVYDPQQMMYMHDSTVMPQMGHYGDGTVWYNMPHQGMPMGGHAHAQGAESTGGTVYYPLPPAPPTSE